MEMEVVVLANAVIVTVVVVAETEACVITGSSGARLGLALKEPPKDPWRSKSLGVRPPDLHKTKLG